jgi:hypothetical protein
MSINGNGEQGQYPNVSPYGQDGEANESQPLLAKTKHKAVSASRGLKKGLKKVSGSVMEFMNPPMWGGLAAVIAGLVPFLKKWLFSDSGWLSPFAESVVSPQRHGSTDVMSLFKASPFVRTEKTRLALHRPPDVRPRSAPLFQAIPQTTTHEGVPVPLCLPLPVDAGHQQQRGLRNEKVC